MRTLMLLAMLGSLASLTTAKAEDTEAAALARTKSLKAKITLDVQAMPLFDFLKEVSAQCEMELAKPPKWTYSPEVDKTPKVSYRCKDKPVDEVLAATLQPLGYGYVVISDPSDRLDGFVRIRKGDERGLAKDATSLANRQAQARLDNARELLQQGKKLPAKAVLTLLLREFPEGPIAAEAKKLLETLDK